MLEPSSVVRESITRESVWRQNGQCISTPFVWSGGVVLRTVLWTNRWTLV